MKESEFIAQLRKSIEFFHPKDHTYKIRDAFKSGKKPYDFYWCHNGKFIAVEAKTIQTKAPKTINFNSLVRPHQPHMLKEVIEAGGMAGFLVNLGDTGTLLVLGPEFVNHYMSENKNLILPGNKQEPDISTDCWIARDRHKVNNQTKLVWYMPAILRELDVIRRTDSIWNTNQHL